jgi:F0F1-type ATP synthase assembly protein I
MTARVRTAMPVHDPEAPKPQGDPWHAFGYLVSGVGLYGFGGWALDRWLGTSWFVVIGILVGASLGIYMTFRRFQVEEDPVSKGDTK